MKTILVSIIALLSVACSGAAPSDVEESEPGAIVHLDTVERQPVTEPAPMPKTVDRLHAHWTLDESFSEEERWTILAAGDIWNGATDGRVVLTFETGSVEPGQKWAIRRGTIEPGTPGRSSINAQGASMTLNPDILPECQASLLLIATHELGHTLGIYGHGVTGGVMTTNRLPGCDFAFLPEDLEMFEAANPTL